MSKDFTRRIIGKPGPRADASLDLNFALSQLAINQRDSSLEALPGVSNYTDQVSEVTFDNISLEYSLDQYIRNDPWPLPSTVDREYYHGDHHYDYWLGGLKDYLRIKQTLAKHKTSSRQLLTNVLDFGCASGRVLRHFLCQEPGLEIWGADININHIEWILQYLGPGPRVFQNTILPILPLEDNSISLVYAFSVFTHIDEFELAWLAEIRRILKPGGLAYLTIQSDHTWGIMNRKHALYHSLLSMKEFIIEHEVSPSMFEKPLPGERVVYKWYTAATYNCHIFLSTDYIQRVWGRFFNILEIIREGAGYQDVVVLNKKKK